MTAEIPPEAPAPHKHRTGLIIIGAVVLVFVFVPAVLMATTPHPHGTLYDDPPLVEDFTLPRADGGTFTLSEQRGRTVLLYFGYTSCPDICPATLYDLKRTVQQLGDLADQLDVVFVTIDPANDTPDKIVEYLGYFDPTFIGLYGTVDQLAAVEDQYGVEVFRADQGQVAGNYPITHSASMFIIDPDGYLKLRLHHDTEVQFLVQDLSYVIKGRL